MYLCNCNAWVAKEIKVTTLGAFFFAELINSCLSLHPTCSLRSLVYEQQILFFHGDATNLLI